MATVALASESQNRPQITYSPSPWGDFFINHNPCTPSQLLSMKETADVMKEEVRKTILEAAASTDMIRKLELVDTLQHIGVDYHYKQEIDDLLRQVYDDKDGGSDDDLYVTSLRFYVLRKHGYSVSSDVFLKFRDEKGNVSSDEVYCLTTLYDAAHLRTHGEKILDSIITFNKSRLQFFTQTNLDPYLAEEVRITLETPRFRRVERVETRRYISWYEKQDVRDATILEFAKLDFNISQAIYCEELKQLTLWWRDFQSNTDLRFARDRIVELHFWILGLVDEPYHSYARITLTKFILIGSLFDDFYDNYSTTEESNIFTNAIESWDEKTAEQLPARLKSLYINILNTANKIEEELVLQGNKHSEVVKEVVISMAKGYHSEVKWRDERYVPSSIEEHLQMSTRSSGCMHIANMAFILLGATTEAVEWAFTFPKIITAVCIVGRVANDITSHEREEASGHVASTVQTCVKQYGVTVEEAYEKLGVIIEEAWMDIVEECLEWKHPAVLMETVVNLARTMDFMYKGEDVYTLSFVLKSVITSIYVNSV